MSTTATRLITLIMLLQRQPNQKAAALAEELGVSMRTLHRYFGMLDEMGIPIYAQRGPQGGFSLVRGYKLPPLIFTPEEAVAIYLGTGLVSQVWDQLYREPAQGAMAKLDNVLPEEQRGEIAWARRSLVARDMHRADPTALSPMLEKLRRAVRQQCQVEISYQGSSTETLSQRLVDPYALVYRSGWWYLVAFCHLRQALRTFRVDRIRQPVLLSRAFQKPEDFDVHAYLENNFKDQNVVSARLRFKPQAAHIALSNMNEWEIVEQNPVGAPKGSVDVILTAPDLHWLASMVISFATWVIVLDPPELCDLVRDWALATAAQYA